MTKSGKSEFSLETWRKSRAPNEEYLRQAGGFPAWINDPAEFDGVPSFQVADAESGFAVHLQYAELASAKAAHAHFLTALEKCAAVVVYPPKEANQGKHGRGMTKVQHPEPNIWNFHLVIPPDVCPATLMFKEEALAEAANREVEKAITPCVNIRVGGFDVLGQEQ